MKTDKKFDILAALGLFILAAVPRLLTLATFLTADEKNWIGRSYEFIRAFTEFRFNDMLQTTHPGVPALWVTGVSTVLNMIVTHTPFSSGTLPHFIWTAQFPIAFLNALAVPAFYLLLRRLTGRWDIPLLAGILIALDPFLIGYSRVVHVDALVTSFLFLAALTVLLYVQEGYRRSWLVVSAVLASLAILTKVPALFIIPFFILVVGSQLVWTRAAKTEWTARSRDGLLWLLLITLLAITIWPAVVWVPDPQGNVLTVKRDLGVALLTPHDMTEDYTLNPYHYPAALLTRSTPITLAGILLAFVALATTLRGWRSALPIRTVWLLFAYIFFFIVMMTLGAKKGDRYILPVWPALDVLAAYGLLEGAVYLTRFFSHPRFSNWLRGGIMAVVALLLTATVVRYHPYAIAYSNPLFPDNLSQELGWGEGLDQVAAWLNANHPNAVVASWYPEELGAFTSARVAHINAHEQFNVEYVVLYRNMFGRDPSNPANDFIDQYYKKMKPAYVAHIHGRQFAWVYTKQAYEKNVGELSNGVHVGQEVIIEQPNFIGFDLAVATYSGKASAGDLIVQLKKEVGGGVLQEWRVPVRSIEDNRWLTFRAKNAELAVGDHVVVEVAAEGSGLKAPTIRSTATHVFRFTPMFFSDSGALNNQDAVPGNLAIKLRYMAGHQEATEDDTLLFQ